MKPENEFSYRNEWDKGPSFFNSIRGGKSGTAILFNTNQVNVSSPLFDKNGRVIALDVNIGGTFLHIVNTYFPNFENDQYRFIGNLHPFFHSSFPLIWAGDHNISTDNRVDRVPSRDGMDRFGKNILEIMESFDLVDTCRCLYPTQNNRFTYFHGGVRSRIDKIIVYNGFKVKQFYHEACLHSDHVVIVAGLQLDEVIEKGYGIWKNNVSIFKNDVFKDEFKELWEFWKQKSSLTCPVEFWMWVKKRIKSFLIDTGKLLARKKRLQNQDNFQEIIDLCGDVGIDQEVAIQNYLIQKKELAKLQIKNIKEKIDLKRCKDFIEGERPTKCFFQKFRKRGLKRNSIEGLHNSQGELKQKLCDMLSIASDYFEDLFKLSMTNERIANMFIENVEPLNNADIVHIYDDLCRDFTIDELWDAIMSFCNGRSPGPDGLSIEFYKAIFSVIKDDLLCVYNCIKDREYMPSKMKRGLIVLVPKGESGPNMGNYRGITLNNVDLKIFSKMLHYRISPYLEKCIHPSQYSVAGKKDWELNCAIRDIYDEMKSGSSVDSFLVRVDFKKAFDSIDMKFLYLVMEKMGFPCKFINLIKAMDCNVFAQVVINGAKSKKFRVQKGTRQGDPLSLDKFIIALNPLLEALHKNDLVSGFISNSHREFLTLAKADDLTVVTNRLSSLLQIKNTLERYQEASGLEMNVAKTKGFFFNKQNIHQLENLPFEHWNENCIILGIPYGSDKFIEDFWREKFLEFEKEVRYFQSYNFLTLQAKSIISKSKLLPKLSYLGSVLPIPSNFKGRIDSKLLGFVVPHTRTFLKIENLAANKHMGGIGLAHVNLHCEIMLVKSVMLYMRKKVEDGILTPNQYYYIEYNIGHQVSALWDLPVNNSTLHAFCPNGFYSYVLQVLKKLKGLGITRDDMVTGNVSLIYKNALAKLNGYNISPRWKVLHMKVIPNYLISFNYKVHFNLLPVKSKFADYRLDNDSRCPFCDFGFETLFHIMGKCVKLGVVWDYMDELMALMNINYKFSDKRKHLHEFEVMNIRPMAQDFKLILYMTTIINYDLWKYRNLCVYDDRNFDPRVFVSKLIRSVGARKRLQEYLHTDSDIYKVNRIEELLNTMVFLQNISFSYDNG